MRISESAISGTSTIGRAKDTDRRVLFDGNLSEVVVGKIKFVTSAKNITANVTPSEIYEEARNGFRALR